MKEPNFHVKFHCCGDEDVFKGFGCFNMCKCGASGFDSGDGYYTRVLGNPALVEVINCNLDKEYVCQECGELDECHWECPHCGCDSMIEYEGE